MIPLPTIRLRTALELATGLLLLVALAVQTVRIEGLGIWPIRIAGLKAELADAKTALAENARQAAQIAAAADALARKGDALANTIRSRNDAQLVAVDRDADSVLLRGPGKASCPAAAAAAAGGPQPAGGQADAAVAPLPPGERVDLIALPFPGTVAFGRQNDACLVELNNWGDWYTRYSAAVADYRAQVAAASGKKR